jgi:ERCC4-related helicase
VVSSHPSSTNRGIVIATSVAEEGLDFPVSFHTVRLHID